MTINTYRAKYEITLKKLQAGQVFEYDGFYAIKGVDVSSTASYSSIYIVFLDDGNIVEFDPDTLVCPVDAELIIHGLKK